VAMAVSAFFVLRSPLVRQYLPWLHSGNSAKQTEAAAPATERVSTVGEAGARQAQQPERPAQQPPSSAAAGARAASGAAAGAAGLTAAASEGAHGGSAGAGESGRGASTGHRGRSGSAPSAAGDGAVAAASISSQGEPDRQPLQSLSGVAVAVVGEEPLAGTVSSLLRSELQAAGRHVFDAATLPACEELLVNRGEPTASQLMRALRSERVAVLVLARVQRVGERMLNYMDRQDVAYSDRVVLTGYDIATGQERGQSRSVTVEFTQLNLEQATERALGPAARELAEELH